MDDACLVAILRKHLCLTADEAHGLSRRLIRVRRISDLTPRDECSVPRRVPIMVRCINGRECIVVSGSGPHAGKAVCAQCGRFLRWIPRDEYEARQIVPEEEIPF